MQTLHNIEKSAFHKGQYVGYGAGRVWRISKNTWSRLWIATACVPNSPKADGTVPPIKRKRLADVSQKLEALPIDTVGKLPPVNVLED